MKLKWNANFLDKFKMPSPKGVAKKPAALKTDLHPELALVNNRVQWKLWLSLLLTLIVMLSVWIGLSNQAQLNALVRDHEKVVQSDFNEQGSALVQIQQLVTQNQQTLLQAVQQMSSQTQTNQDALLQAINQQQQQTKAMVETVNQLQQQLQQLQKTTAAKATPLGQLTDTQPNDTRKITTEYHIFSVEPYGVVIQNDKGQFQIARIGKRLDLGQITAISADAVQAGEWTIVHNPTPQPAKPAVAPAVNNVPINAVYMNS
jgi:hypothetical protein